VQQLFIHHLYRKKKRRDKKEITKTAFCSFSLSSFLCLLVYSSILSADITTTSTTTIRDDCQVVLNIENYMVNHRSWDMYILGAEEGKKEKRSGGEIDLLYMHTYEYIYTYSFIRCPYNYVYRYRFLFFTLLFPFSLFLRGQPSIVRLWKFNFENILKEEGKEKKKKVTFTFFFYNVFKRKKKKRRWTEQCHLYVHYFLFFLFFDLGFNYNQCLFKTFGSIIITSWITYS
jgi:hypothetical protein